MAFRLKYPRLNRETLFSQVDDVFHPRPSITNRPAGARPTREAILLAAARAAESGALNFAAKQKEGQTPAARNAAYARMLAELYWWSETYNGKRGFVSQKSAFNGKSRDKRTGAVRKHSGVEAALLGLLNSGVTRKNLFVITRTVLSLEPELFNAPLMSKKNQGTYAIRLYHEKLKPLLLQHSFFPPAYARNENIQGRIDHCLCFIMNLGFEREKSAAKQQEIFQKMRERAKVGREQARRDRIFSRRDVQEELEKGASEQDMLDLFPKKPEKEKRPDPPKNRFK